MNSGFLRRHASELVAASSGALFATAAPPFDFAAAIVFGLAGFAWSLRDADTIRSGAWRGFLFGLAANVVALRFVPDVIARFTPLPWALGVVALVLLAAAQAVAWFVCGALATALRGSRVHLSRFVSFAVGVYAATFVPTVFSWTPAAGLALWPSVLQVAEFIGERGVSLVIALAAAFLVEGASKNFERAAGWCAAAIVVVAGLAAFGTWRMKEIDARRAGAPSAHVALVQPYFDASDRWDAHRAEAMMTRLTAVTKEAEARGAALTVWPESAYPYTLGHGTKHQPSGPRVILRSGVHGPVLTGAYLAKPGGGTNSALLVQRDGSIGKSYDKRHLLWFGETVPLSDVFPWLRKIFAKGTGLVAGSESVALVTGDIRAAVLNCYEDTLPIAGREAMDVSPNLLVNITNDAWFAGSIEGELHLRLSTLRAIETRRDLVRTVNRGPTSFVDAAGRIRDRYDAAGAGSLSVSPALLDGITTYVRFGDIPLLAAIGVFAIVIALARRGTLARPPLPPRRGA